MMLKELPQILASWSVQLTSEVGFHQNPHGKFWKLLLILQRGKQSILWRNPEAYLPIQRTLETMRIIQEEN